MGARNGTSENYNMVRDRWDILGAFVGNGAASPTTVKGLGLGIASVTRTALGAYTITLTDKWTAFLNAEFCVVDSTGNNHFEVTVVSETVASTKTINIQVFSAVSAASPAKADLASTATLKFEITVTNTQQKPAPF